MSCLHISREFFLRKAVHVAKQEEHVEVRVKRPNFLNRPANKRALDRGDVVHVDVENEEAPGPCEIVVNRMRPGDRTRSGSGRAPGPKAEHTTMFTTPCGRVGPGRALDPGTAATVRLWKYAWGAAQRHRCRSSKSETWAAAQAAGYGQVAIKTGRRRSEEVVWAFEIEEKANL